VAAGHALCSTKAWPYGAGRATPFASGLSPRRTACAGEIGVHAAPPLGGGELRFVQAVACLQGCPSVAEGPVDPDAVQAYGGRGDGEQPAFRDLVGQVAGSARGRVDQV
jgi:hypothetical protein